MKVQYKRLHPNAKVPTKATPDSAACDLYSMENAYIPHGETVKIRTGLALQIPDGWKGEIYSRSGLASQGIVVMNSPGKIDSDYRGEIMVLLHNTRKELVAIEKGDRIAQFEVNPVYEIDWVNDWSEDTTRRGEGGFGSTGS